MKPSPDLLVRRRLLLLHSCWGSWFAGRLGAGWGFSVERLFLAKDCQYCPKQISLMGRVSFDTFFWLKKKVEKERRKQSKLSELAFPERSAVFF